MFDVTETKIVGSFAPNPKQEEDYILRNPNKVVLDNIPSLSEHRVSYKNLNFTPSKPLFKPQKSISYLSLLLISLCR